MCVITKLKILHQKCCKVRWRNALVDVSCRLPPTFDHRSGKTLPGKLQNLKGPFSNPLIPADLAADYLQWRAALWSIKSSPPPGTGTRCKTSSGGFRRENPTVERHDWDVKGVKYIRIRKRKRTKRPGWEWLRGRELRLNRQNHPHRRTKWNADHQSSHKKPHLLQIQRWDAHLP